MIPSKGKNVFKLASVPNGWKACLLDEAVKIQGGSQPPKKLFRTELEDGYVRLVQIRDYKSDRYLTYIPEASTKKFCTEEDIMIGRYGPPVFQILRGISGAYNVALMKAIPLVNMDRDFLFHLLSSPPVQNLVIDNSQRTAGQTGVNLRLLNSCIIPLPPLDRQKKIAAILDVADAYRQKTKALIAKYDELTQSLFLEMFGGALNNPMGWELKTIGETCKIQGGYSFKSKDYVKNGVKLVKIANVHFEDLRWNEVDQLPANYLDEHKNFSLNKGDILMALTRPIIKSLGTVKAVTVKESDLPCLLNQRVARFLPEEKWLNKRFLLSYIFSEHFKNKIDKFSSTSLQPNVSNKQIEGLEIMLPPIELQNLFAERVQAIEIQKTQTQTTLVKAEDLFNSLLQRAFKGGIE